MAITCGIRVRISGHTFHLLFDHSFWVSDGETDWEPDPNFHVPAVLDRDRRDRCSVGECADFADMGWGAVAQGAS